MVSRRETWTTDEFGTSHAGAVGAVLADGTVRPPVYFDAGSGGGGNPVSQWSVAAGTDQVVAALAAASRSARQMSAADPPRMERKPPRHGEARGGAAPLRGAL
ncbi:hypothetical protein [Streptomyces sp. NPDC058401]|uniref:hypothetical protein n=1 Tax=Streptomyces sp. NPDC058401 TaxID=3346480 RepID=UPI003647A94C